jgi:hypothetical protein
MTTLGAPMDVLWFRLGQGRQRRARSCSARSDRAHGGADRPRTYWQCAFLIPKGAAAEVKARGLAWLADQLRALFPELDLSGGPQSTDDLHLLSVALDRSTAGTAPACSRSATRRTQ